MNLRGAAVLNLKGEMKMEIQPVRSHAVWKQVRIVFLGAALLFLINNYFGFDNALTVGDPPRGQLLIHLHAGSIGWITLSAIGLAIWLLTGQRDVSQAYEGRVRLLGWAAVILFALYIPNFWIAFSGAQGAVLFLLPIFGAGAVLVLWSSAIYALAQLRRQEPLTTVQMLISGALLVAAIGATVGMLLGMERAVGRFLPLPEGDRVGAHAGMMDTYLFLVASSVIEWFTLKGERNRWTIAGLLQAVFWAVGATLVPIAFFLNAVEQLLPIFGILLILGLIIFLVRIGWRAVLMGPTGDWPRPWAFFGTLWLVVDIALFLYAVSSPDFESLPAWFPATFAHAGFVGMMTNLLLGVLSARSQSARDVWAWGEPAAMWTINLGLLVFIGLKAAADIRLGAIVMGIGVVLGVITMILRLRASGARMSRQPSVSPSAAP
jgi:hypothetical protein